MIRVAGVQFNNDAVDGGRNRQDILSEIYKGETTEILVDAEYIQRKDKSYAIRLRDHVTEQVIGWMHTDTANTIVEGGRRPKYYIGYVDYHGSYHVKLDDVPDDKLDGMLKEYDDKRICYQCNRQWRVTV